MTEPVRTAIPVGESLKARNDRQAQANRNDFLGRGLVVLNLLSSPGSGKTAILERTLSEFGTRRRIGVIVGDLQTDNDARRLRGRGAPVVPITTGTVCHLDAEMVARACDQLALSALELLVIENVGNLVCPASFDLGEQVRGVVLSCTEGEDKPLKYPRAFKTSSVVLVNKIDLAGPAGFDRDQALGNVRAVTPQAKVIELSARTGDGLGKWFAYLDELIESARRTRIEVPPC